MLIDTHCHLDYEYDGKDVATLLREANAAGVSTLVTIGVDTDHIATIRDISEKFPDIYHSVGFHPHEASRMQDADLARLRECLRHPKCVALGEIGLDYHYDHSPREIQQARLKELLDLALDAKKPIIIHSRDGEADLLPMLQAYAAKARASIGLPVGVIHCFTGTEAFAKACLEAGFLISFSGIVTFKKADDIRAVASQLRLDQFCVETDSPYLAPMPYRGKKCEPAMVRKTAEFIADLKNVPFEELAQATSANARKLFRI